MGKRKGFTLVELLVVIAIIALLIAILIPALRKAKNQAKVLSCAANSKQIATILAVYQGDNDGYVPVMRNKWAIIVSAKSALLSLPFRNYSGDRVKLPTWLNPDQSWDWDQVLDYSQNYLPDFYICPFVRNKSEAENWHDTARVEICPAPNLVERWDYRSDGKGESYSTWIWPRPAGYPFIVPHCYGPDHGINKYRNLVWHTGGNPLMTGCWANQLTCPHGQFDQVHVARFTNRRRISDRTAVYCAHGEIDESRPHDRVISYGSHKKGKRGGTNVVFGDSHVEWVQGSQITAGN